MNSQVTLRTALVAVNLLSIATVSVAWCLERADRREVGAASRVPAFPERQEIRA